MIAYLQDKDVMVEVPDDISENDLADLQKNFDTYFPEDKTASNSPTPSLDSGQVPTTTTEQPKSFKRDFFEGYLKSVIPSLGIADSTRWAIETPEGRAFSGKALDSFTFGLTKPLTEPFLKDEYKDNPVYDMAGEMVGGIGSLLATGGLLRIAGLGVKAASIGQSATQIGAKIPAIANITAKAPRLLTPAIMTGATFGTNTFIKKTVESLQNGGVDIEDFGKSVAKDTLFGSSLGAISGISAPAAVSSAYGLGYLSAKSDGADNVDAHLNGAIWAAFELIGSFGKDVRLKTEALKRTGSSLGEYVKAKNPNIPKEEAENIGQAFLRAEAEKVGGLDNIIKGDKKDALQLIENINQRVRGAKVEVSPEIKQDPLKIENKTPGTVKTSEPFAPVPVEPVRPVSSLDQVPQPIEQVPQVNQGTSIVSEALPSNIFPLTEVSSDQSIAEHPNFKQLTDDAGFIVNKYAQMRGVEPTKDLAVSLYREFHDTLGQIMRAPPEKRLEVATKIKSEFPNIEQEFTTLKDKVYSDETEKYFNRNIANNYSPLNRNVPGGIPQKQNILSENVPQENNLQMRPTTQDGGTDQLSEMSRQYDEIIQKIAPNDKGAAQKGQLQGLYSSLRQSGKTDQEALQELRGYLESGSPQGLQQSLGSDVALPTLPPQNPSESISPLNQQEPAYLESGVFFDKLFPSSKGGTSNRQFGELEDQISALKKSLGGLEYIKKIEGPELVQLAKMISGNVPLIKKLTRSLGYFKPNGEQIVLSPELFKDPKLWEAVLAHEIGHLIDFNPEKTMNRGNILGRIASFKDYLKSLLPESPDSPEVILTPEDRARFRAMAQKIAKGGDNSPEAEFDPQMILNVWNAVVSDATPELMDYIKGLNVDEKKSLIKSAMQAIKKNEKITIYDINKFNKDAKKNLKSVSDIYRDILKKEIKKRKLWENEVIRGELKKLTQYWKPFDDKANTGFTTYRYSSPELYADFISVLFNAPAKALQIAPDSYKAFFNYLENKPEVMKSFIEIQSVIQSGDEDLQKLRYENLLKMFERGEQVSRKLALDMEAAKKSSFDKLGILFDNKNNPMLRQGEILKGQKEVPANEDIKFLLSKKSRLGMFVKSYLDDFDKDVLNPAKEAGKEVLDGLGAILYLDRVGDDRAEMANPGGHTPKTAKELLDYLQNNYPDKFETANMLAQKARDWFKNITRVDGYQDFFTPEQIAIQDMGDKYAPYRVISHMKDYMTAGMAQQVGTLGDISNPLTSILMKGIAVVGSVEKNRITKLIIEKTLIPSGFPITEAKVTSTPDIFHVQNPPNNNQGTILYKSEGKWKAYHVDKDISDRFDGQSSIELVQFATAINVLTGNDFFRKMYITFNLGFQSSNLIRDFLTTWAQNPELTFTKLLKRYFDALPSSKNRVKDIYDPIINSMERSGALNMTWNDLNEGKIDEDNETERILSKHGVVDKNDKETEKGVSKLLDSIKYLGDVLETIPKVAGWNGMETLPIEERAFRVATFVGTPDFKVSGTATPATNALFLFSNIFKEGMKNFIDVGFKDKERRGTFWRRTFISSMMPKILMGMATAGYFGLRHKRMMEKVPEYIKTNYTVIPIKEDEYGNVICLTLPIHETGRMIGGMFWKMLNHNGDLSKNITDILAFGEGLIPGMAPAFSLARVFGDYVTGGMPQDKFRGHDILTAQERAAGGMYAFEPMARWTLNQTGLIRLDIRDRLKDEPMYKTIISLTPGVNRFIRVFKSGEREIAQDEARKAQKIEARESLDIKQSAIDAIRKGESVTEFAKDAKSIEESRKMRGAYNRQKKGFTSDPYIQALNSASSNNQKLSILKMIKSKYKNENEFNDYLNSLYLNKIISARVVLEARD